MRKVLIILAAAGIVAGLAFTGCFELDPISPPPVSTGKLDFTRYLALGNSLTAGYQSGGLVEKYQRLSYPALIAQAARLDSLAMPWISEPGIPPLFFAASLIPFVLDTLDGQGSPMNLNYQGIYNNLGIPAATTGDLIRKGPADPNNPFFGIVLRDSAFGANALRQAMNFQPTVVTLWIGANDILGSVLMGSDQFMTPLSSFEADFTAIVDSLLQLTDHIVAANLPAIPSIPYATTVPPFLVDPITGEVILNPVTGDTIPLVGYVKGHAQPESLTTADLVLLPAAALIADSIGWPTAVGGKGPLPEEYIVDRYELANISATVQQFNDAIASICSARNIPVVDVYSFFNDVGANGITIRGEHFTTDYVTGGLFSLDGVHPSTLGYYIVAREFIETMNKAFGSSLPDPMLPVQPRAAAGALPERPPVTYAFSVPEWVFARVKQIFPPPGW